MKGYKYTIQYEGKKSQWSCKIEYRGKITYHATGYDTPAIAKKSFKGLCNSVGGNWELIKGLIKIIK